MSELTISIRDLRRLIEPVTGFASSDEQLPVLNCVRVESRGTHLMAFATDRFRLACQRVAAPEGATWPEFQATIPLASIRSLFQTYKAKRFAEPVLTLRVDEGAHALYVNGDDALLDMLDASVTYPLSDGTFPNVLFLLREAIDDEGDADGSDCGVDQKFLADFARVSLVMHMRVRGTRKPILFADGEDFIGVLMPRRMIGGSEGLDRFPGFESWDTLLAAPKAVTKKKVASRSRKGRVA